MRGANKPQRQPRPSKEGSHYFLGPDEVGKAAAMGWEEEYSYCTPFRDKAYRRHTPVSHPQLSCWCHPLTTPTWEPEACKPV